MNSHERIDLGVYPIVGEQGRYHVLSSGHVGLLYLVDLDDSTDFDAFGGCRCGCRDFEIRSGMLLYPAPDCKHIRLVKVYRRLQQAFKRVKTV